jgi:hypothetical protein
VKFNTVFAFRPVATKSLAAVGAAFQIPITLELLFFQLFYIIFQVTWITFSIPYFVGVTGVNAVHAAVFSSIFIAVNILKFWVNYLTWGGCVITGLGLGLVLIAAVYVRADRVSNFFNRQLLFSFTVPNRWFGSNLAPGLSLSSTPISVGSTWVRLLESIVGRAESLVVSTSALRLDPKQMDLSFW